ncbi:HPr family phosphocarrier protein [Marinicellulosiphila megalodicopiae]|uniref:HPr family phosphocarrier protein n=1 Tax=Marinicellulosiphila megalodicopiae TaxID=2724896 RepID=UPI003BAE7B87
MIEAKIEVINKLGLHARAAAKLVGVANQFSSNILLDKAGKTANAKSIMTVMMLGAAKGTILDVSAEGKDEQAAIDAIKTIFNNYFDEGE